MSFDNEKKRTIKCKLCNCDIDNSKQILTNNSLNNEEFYFYYCDKCEALTSQDFDRSNLYERNVSNTNYIPSNQTLFKFLKYIFIKFSNRKFLNQGLKSKKILDYGCGNGDLANISLEYGANVFAYDVQDNKPEALKEEIVYFSNKNFESSNEKFNLIFSRHVIEHVPNPIKTIKLLYAKLENDGKLIIEVPNLDSIHRKFMGRFWTGYFSPYHEIVFSKKSFERICSDLMFEYEIYEVEPLVLGLFFMHFGFPRNIARIFSLIFYPIQLLISKAFRTGEAIVCVIHKK